MSQDRPRDAATVLFNLPGYRVLDAVDDPGGGRRVLVEPVDRVGHCPDCGFDSARVHSRPVSRVADVPIGGRLEVRVRKRRLWCGNVSCDRLTFTQTTDQLGLRARITTRLAGHILPELMDHRLGEPVRNALTWGIVLDWAVPHHAGTPPPARTSGPMLQHPG